MRGMRTRTKYTHPLVSAARNLKSFAALVEFHGKLFKQAIANGNPDAISRHAEHLHRWAMQAVWAGNLILNNGQPVALVIAKLEAEMAERRKEQGQ